MYYKFYLSKIMKHRIYLILLALTTLLIACEEEPQNQVEVSDDTRLIQFYVSHDSIPSLKKIAFIIDNDSNVIYNTDSLPYLTPVDSLIPTMYGSTLKSIYINDTIAYTGQDTIDFSKPVTIKTTATDGTSTRTYVVRVHAHQINPDLYNWQGIKSEIFSDLQAVQQKTLLFANQLNYFVRTAGEIVLFTSNDGVNWSRNAVSGLPTTTDLNGIVATEKELLAVSENTLYKATNPTTWTTSASASVSQLFFVMNDEIFALGESEGKPVIFSSADLATWKNLGALPEKFPAEDFAICVNASPSGKYRAYVVGGKTADGELLNSVWSSENGSYWVNLAQEDWFTPRYGSAVIQYADGLMLIGGADENGAVADRQWISPDYGLTWHAPDSASALPDLWLSRYGHSAVVDDENQIFIVGGQTATSIISDVWTGRKINEMPGFQH